MADRLEKAFEEWQQAQREYDTLNNEYTPATPIIEGQPAPARKPLTDEAFKLFDRAWQKVKDKQDAFRKASM